MFSEDRTCFNIVLQNFLACAWLGVVAYSALAFQEGKNLSLSCYLLAHCCNPWIGLLESKFTGAAGR